MLQSLHEQRNFHLPPEDLGRHQLLKVLCFDCFPEFIRGILYLYLSLLFKQSVLQLIHSEVSLCIYRGTYLNKILKMCYIQHKMYYFRQVIDLSQCQEKGIKRMRNIALLTVYLILATFRVSWGIYRKLSFCS